ncbi:hypothetical protein D3C75_1105380 [compost metagenome]
MADFNTLADVRKHRRMFTNNVARTHGGKANSAWNALAGVPFTRVNGALFQIFVHRISDGFAHG